MAKDRQKALGEAHTRGETGQIAPIEADDAPGAGDQGDEFADLIDGSPDLLAIGGLATAAEQHAVQRRGRGRPKGSANKRNTSLFDYLEALGHRDPAVTLSMIQTADTRVLAAHLGVGDSAKSLLAVAGLQVKAAAELLPYKYAKKPQQLDLGDTGGQRPVMVIGQLNGDINAIMDGGFMSAGDPPRIVENQPLSDDEPCDKTQSCRTDETSG